MVKKKEWKISEIMQSAIKKLTGKIITPDGLLLSIYLWILSKCTSFYFSAHLLLFLNRALCFNNKNYAIKKHETCKHDKLWLLNTQDYSFNLFKSQMILKHSAQEKTLFKLQIVSLHGKIIGNGYTYKDTAIKLNRKMISHDISATYHFKKAKRLKISNKNRGIKNYLLSMHKF